MITFNRNSIRVLRMSKGLSLEKFAEEAGGGLTKQHVSNWETGKSMPSLRSLLRIINKFSVPMDIFFVDEASHSGT
jgi:transcriptional regulator with XRE-family HTH domain